MCYLPGVQEAAIRNRTILFGEITLLALASVAFPPAPPAELSPEAARGFQKYAQLSEQRMQRNLAPGTPFLWADGLPEPQRKEVYARLEQGEIVTAKLHTADPSGETRTPGALLIHWVGTVFIPGVKLAQVLDVVEDYDRHAEYYRPEVIKASLIGHAGDLYQVRYRLRKKKIITVILDVEYDVHRHTIDSTHANNNAFSTRVAQVEHAGEPDEHELPPGKDGGYLWRLNSYWRYFDSGRGVFVQCEAISLSRDIPMGLAWLLGPIAESVPRESLEFTLGSTRAAAERLSSR